jgi:hypothetical protein
MQGEFHDAVPSWIERRVRSRHPNAIMARGEGIGEPSFMAASRHARTPVQATRRFVSSHHGDMTMKPGLATGFAREYGIIDLVTRAAPSASGQSR